MREFRGDNRWIELRDYLKELAKRDNKPFDCPLLAVLPELVKWPGVKWWPGPIEYPKGTLLCWRRVNQGGIGGSISCDITSIVLNKDNQMKAFCGWNGSTFTLSIVSFEPKKYPVGSR